LLLLEKDEMVKEFTSMNEGVGNFLETPVFTGVTL